MSNLGANINSSSTPPMAWKTMKVQNIKQMQICGKKSNVLNEKDILFMLYVYTFVICDKDTKQKRTLFIISW